MTIFQVEILLFLIISTLHVNICFKKPSHIANPTNRMDHHGEVCKTSLNLEKFDETSKNYRFWSQNLVLEVNNSESITLDNIDKLIQESITRNGIEFARIENGLVFHKSLGIVIPIHDGIVQTQHITKYSDNNKHNSLFEDDEGRPLSQCGPDNSDIVLYCFSPRAKHVIISPNEEERPTDVDRLNALIESLKTYANISADELMSEDLAGTPPARIFRSFVAPRPNSNFILEVSPLMLLFSSLNYCNWLMIAYRTSSQ